MLLWRLRQEDEQREVLLQLGRVGGEERDDLGGLQVLVHLGDAAGARDHVGSMGALTDKSC